MSGLGTAMLAFLILGIAGIVDSPSDAVPLIFLQFLGLLTAGFVAGRIAGRDRVLHGGFAGIALFGAATAITLAASPDSASPLVLAFTAVLAAVLGSAGGALAQVLAE